MAAPNADDKTLWSALNRVALTEFLKSEQGLDTPLLEQGANFSGGQRQRLALARALLHNSSVYIFDEATSNIDVESENIILDTIHSLSKTKTVILIAHRLANVVSADNIYVLKEGALVEQGAHECLLSQKGYYFKLWETQQALTAFNKGGKA
jgi:ABC-type multidrug transport system fused ATPase/permease subunit